MQHFENKYIRIHYDHEHVVRRTLTPDAIPTINLGCASIGNSCVSTHPFPKCPKKEQTYPFPPLQGNMYV